MKKHDFKKLALLGLASGCLIANQLEAHEIDSSKRGGQLGLKSSCPGPNGCPDLTASKQETVPAKNVSKPVPPKPVSDDKSHSDTQEDSNTQEDPNDGNLGYHLMTEDELLLELTENGKRIYNSLDAKGKELALKVASGRCDHTNECAGLNSCQTDNNDCAGKGECKGTGKCAIADKNLAVKLVYEKMAKKRTNIQKTK